MNADWASLDVYKVGQQMALMILHIIWHYKEDYEQYTVAQCMMGNSTQADSYDVMSQMRCFRKIAK